MTTIETDQVPQFDDGDLYADWAPDEGVIYLWQGKSADGVPAREPAHIVSPEEVQKLYAWVEEHKLT